MTWLAVLSVLEQIPARAWRAVGILLLLGASVWLLLDTHHNAVDRARRHVLDSVRTASALQLASYTAQRERWTQERAALLLQKARVDTIVKRRVDSIPVLASFIPESLRSLPAISSFIRTCTSLARDCDSLRLLARRIDTVTLKVEAVDTTMVRAQRVTLELRTAERDTARAESARKVSKTKAGVVAGTVGAAVFAACRFLLPCTPR